MPETTKQMIRLTAFIMSLTFMVLTVHSAVSSDTTLTTPQSGMAWLSLFILGCLALSSVFRKDG